MVKILGEDPKTYKCISCKNCGALLEYVPADVKEYHGTDISGGPDGREWIDCPRCQHEVIINAW